MEGPATCLLLRQFQATFASLFNIGHIIIVRYFNYLISSQGMKYLMGSQFLKINQNVAFEFLNFGIFHQFLSD